MTRLPGNLKDWTTEELLQETNRGYAMRRLFGELMFVYVAEIRNWVVAQKEKEHDADDS